MGSAPVIDLDSLRRSCAQCSLRQLCLAAGVESRDLALIDAIVRRKREVARGGRLFRPGDALSAIYVARAGAFKTVSTSEEGEEQVLGFHMAGELIGMDALGAGWHRCEAVALVASEICEIPIERLEAVVAQVPGLQRQLLRVIGSGVDRDQDHIQILVRRQAGERIALFLHGLGERLRRAGERADVIRLPMSREEIGNFLGLALETVSRGFTRLQEDGVIAVSGRRVEVVDPRALSRLAHGAEHEPPRRGGHRA
ncbi:MAG: helix-turn-helix domain-containing protein [Gammaproteobacteria bacterium]